jgi:hypothetical protein
MVVDASKLGMSIQEIEGVMRKEVRRVVASEWG